MTVEVRAPAGEADRTALHAVRHEVFTIGQGVPVSIERDDLDATADHALALLDGRVVGTGRLLAGDDGIGRVGRMAVLDEVRGHGVGAAVLRFLEGRAADRGLREIELHAQSHACGFYARAGYEPVGAEYEEAGIPHRTMRKPLPVLRDVRDDDAAALIELIGGCWSEYPGCVLDIDAEEPWLRAPAAAYARWSGRMWVVELDGVVRACVGLKPLEAGVAELKSLYVAAPARRRGVGERLTRLVEAEARRLGCTRIELWSDTRFAAAHHLYERLGYTRLPHTRDLHDLSNTTEYAFARSL